MSSVLAFIVFPTALVALVVLMGYAVTSGKRFAMTDWAFSTSFWVYW